MPSSQRLLYSNPTPATSSASVPELPVSADSDVVVILTALLCALICVVGLTLVARCAWLRRSPTSQSPPPAPAAKGLKKKEIRALPKLKFESLSNQKLVECPICLGEFAEGDEVRVLPGCGHGFHAGCVDTWLGAHSSCPSCRRVLVVEKAAPARCQKCGASSAAREGGDANFLP